MGANVIHLETHCLWGELEHAIPALFELPGVPVADAQIHRAVATVKRMADTEGPSPILHFRARYSPDEGSLLIYQVLKDRPHCLPIWGLNGLPRVG